ncbi:DUF4870 domain-containing protein [Uliginosibacterium gangwonense]|uniref:DUF4870 domain-containing protein n=1 Tax=Uliginosibacterium gangwonense TaxID=392736 RepID=UPI00037A81FF|nr:DUF4870 domain-containing protein [Uliginosibacterium gangwonense]
MANEISAESKQLALLIWVGSIIFGFIPSLILFLTKKDDEFVLDQSKEALNWTIVVAIALVVLSVVARIIPFVGLLSLLVWGASVVFCIMGAVAVNKGEKYRLPFSITIIK